MRGIDLSRALISRRNYGTIDTRRNTRNTRSNLAINTPEPPAGMRLPITIKQSKIFQPLLKNL